MRTHTPIPEANSYGIALLIVYSLSCFSIAGQIHSRWLAALGVHFASVYSAVMSFTVALGFLLIDPNRIFGCSAITWIISVPIGLVAGLMACWCDRRILRHLSRRRLMQVKSGEGGRLGYNWRTQPASNLFGRFEYAPVASSLVGKRRSRFLKTEQDLRSFSEIQQIGVSSLVIIAVLEEMIFRGFLLNLCFALPTTYLITIAVFGTILFFSLSHIHFGWPHVLAKLPLGVLTTITALWSGAVLPAIVAHVVFNFRAWKDQRNRPVWVGHV
jgi:hypothetical protein